MRILPTNTAAGHGNEQKYGAPNGFATFAYDPNAVVGDGLESGRSSSNSRQPSRDVMTEIRRLPSVKSNVPGPKRRLLEDDDEEDSDGDGKGVADGGEWLEKLPKGGGASTTTHPRKIAKRPISSYYDDSDIIVDTPERKKTTPLSAILKAPAAERSVLEKPHDGLSDLAAYRQRHGPSTTEAAVRKSEDGYGRAASGNTVIVLDKSDESSDGSSVDSEDSSDSDSDSEGAVIGLEGEIATDDGYDQWNESRTKDQTQRQAATTLRMCKTLSANLQTSLQEWRSGQPSALTAQDGATLDRAAPNAVGATGDGCIDLVSIKQGTNLITHEDVQQFAACGVALKPYQLVGVNWIKLLRENNVQGVLAGKCRSISIV